MSLVTMIINFLISSQWKMGSLDGRRQMLRILRRRIFTEVKMSPSKTTLLNNAPLCNCRVRTCTNPAPTSGGTQCSGDASDSIPCGMGPCQVDGGWSTFAELPCSKTCGDGVILRLVILNKLLT